MHFRNQRGIGPALFDIERIDENGKADCVYYGDNTGSDYELHLSKLLNKVLDMVSA